MSMITAAVLALLAVLPAAAEISPFAANEVRVASVKDRLRGVSASLKDGTEGAKRHGAAVSEAFRDADDWAPAVEAYYARKRDLLARASALDETVDAEIVRNEPEREAQVTKALDALVRRADALRADYEFYMRLPKLAEGPHRRAAQAAMRLLAQTGDYPVTHAYYLDKIPRRRPFEVPAR
jgi:hypothetical protein